MSRPTLYRVLGIAVGVGLVAGGVIGYGLTRSSGVANEAKALSRPTSPLVSEGRFEARSGVRISQLAVTGAGGLLDLRFQVLDSDRANSVHQIPPMLVDERTGVVVNELFMGHQHHGRMRAGQSYYLIFNNPGNLVVPGSRVTVQLGPAQVAHVPVR